MLQVSSGDKLRTGLVLCLTMLGGGLQSLR